VNEEEDSSHHAKGGCLIGERHLPIFREKEKGENLRQNLPSNMSGGPEGSFSDGKGGREEKDQWREEEGSMAVLGGGPRRSCLWRIEGEI